VVSKVTLTWSHWLEGQQPVCPPGHPLLSCSASQIQNSAAAEPAKHTTLQNSQSGNAQRFPTNAVDNANRVKVHTTLISPAKIKRHSKPFAILHTHAQKQMLVPAIHRSDLVPGAVLAHVELASQLLSAEGLAGSQLQDFCLSQGCSWLQGCQQPWGHLACLPPAPL